MNDADSVLLSVRAEARQLVAPDYAVLDGLIEHTAGSRVEAVRSVTASLERLTADLAALGGVPFDEGAGDRPLTWSAHSSATREERYHDKETGRVERSGQVTATVALRVTVRDLDTLGDVSGVLAAHPSLNVHGVTWHVDWDNPAWQQVRAAAIGAAVRKARDYAAALGARLRQVEHVADAGLLGGDTAPSHPGRVAAALPPAPVSVSQGPQRSIPYRRNSSPPSRLASVPPKYPCRALKAIPGSLKALTRRGAPEPPWESVIADRRRHVCRAA